MYYLGLTIEKRFHKVGFENNMIGIYVEVNHSVQLIGEGGDSPMWMPLLYKIVWKWMKILLLFVNPPTGMDIAENVYKKENSVKDKVQNDGERAG